MVMGRRLLPARGSPYWPAPFQVSRGSNRLVIDFGNSIPLESAGGAVAGPSSLTAIILSQSGTDRPLDAARRVEPGLRR